MKLNDDGSVDIYFAPKAPKGMESNWIPTGEDFFLLFRLYGPDKPLFDKTWNPWGCPRNSLKSDARLQHERCKWRREECTGE